MTVYTTRAQAEAVPEATIIADIAAGTAFVGTTPITGRTAGGRLKLGRAPSDSTGSGITPAQAQELIDVTAKSAQNKTDLDAVKLVSDQSVADINAIRDKVTFLGEARHPLAFFFESPSLPGVVYKFYARSSVPIRSIVSFTGDEVDVDQDGKIVFLISPWDSAGVSTWIWGYNLERIPHDPSTAKFWGSDPDYPQTVAVGRCNYFPANDATLAQKEVRPELGVIGQKLNGWIRDPDNTSPDIA